MGRPRLQALELTGTPRERGVTHGATFADEIAANLDRYLDVFEFKGSDEETVYEQAEAFVPLIADENPAYFEEMQGIAEGSDLQIEDVTILNARYEVMYSAFKSEADDLDDTAPLDGCTAFCARPEITADGHTYLGQNWDWVPGIETFVMDVRRDDAPNMVAMTEAGIVGGKIGVNEHGLGMTLNGLVTEEDGENPFRKPYHVRFREVLDSTRMDEAIAPLITKPRACSANVILAHADGEMIDFELAPETVNYLYPEDGLLTHANHVEDRTRMNSEFEKLTPSTLFRASRLRRLLATNRGEIDAEVVMNAFRDHFSKPNSLCSHPDPDDPELDRSQTNGSFIMDLTDRRFLGTNGPPCENDYHEFRVA